MYFQDIVDSFGMAAAVISVEDKQDGRYGEIRIVCANSMYKQIMGEKYRDNMIYSELIPKEPNFEDFCYRCAVKKQHLHAYVDVKAMGLWSDGTYIPLSESLDNGNIHYFAFYFEFTSGPESEKMSNVSMDSAAFVIQTCIKLRSSYDFCGSMEEVSKDIREKTDAFCSSIVLLDEEKNRSTVLCMKFKDDLASYNDYKDDLNHEVISSWKDSVSKHNIIIVKDENDMQALAEENPLWGKSLRNSGVQSLILAPFFQNNKILGYLFVTNFNTKRVVEIKELLELTSFFLSSAIANNNLMERLEFMSNVDLLTGLRNRNSMNYRVDLYLGDEKTVEPPFGVVFADLNGLKQINDNEGHAAGDILLKKAANLLNEVFGQYEIYRAGGDEFVIIAPNCPKDLFEKKVGELRAKSSYGSEVCFAIGSYWDKNGDNLRLSMHLADEAMYADKNNFYISHPEKTRRA